jgi:4-hydroxythreonine-4-phosphate dehydrogenase
MPNLEDLPIAITMGDPCGIGPEIVAKLCADSAPVPPTLVLGDEGMIRRAIRVLGLPLTLRVIDSPEDFQLTPNMINVISLSRLPAIYLLDNLTRGRVKRHLTTYGRESILP